MTDETVAERRPVMPVWLLLALAAVALAAAEFASGEGHFLRASAAPAGLAAALLLGRRRPFIARLEGDGLDVLSPRPEFVPYDRIEALHEHGGGRDDSFAFTVVHDRGVLYVPAGLTVPSIELFEFLRERLPAEEAEVAVPASLRPFREEQEEHFGTDRVWCYQAQPRPVPPRSWRGVLLWAAVCLVGIVWMGTGFGDRDHKTWVGLGAVAMAVGFFGMLLAASIASRAVRGKGPSGPAGLVIGPLGFALQQGDVRGRMRWDEITAITRNATGIVVAFAGGSVTIRDIYNRPTSEIFRRLRDYWDGPA
jgi:hypothetical protein